MPKASWRSVGRGYYEVSCYGQVRRKDSGHVLKQCKDKKGYMNVFLSEAGVKLHVHVHVLVARAFLGPCPRGKEVNHRDLNKQNNHWRNLEYLTPAANIAHAIYHGAWKRRGRGVQKGVPHPAKAKLTHAKAVELRRLYKSGMSYTELGVKFSICYSLVRNVVAKRAWV